MKLSEFIRASELIERRDDVIQWIDRLGTEGAEVMLSLEGAPSDEGVNDEEESKPLMAAIKAYFSELKASIDRDLVALGMVIDEDAGDAGQGQG